MRQTVDETMQTQKLVLSQITQVSTEIVMIPVVH